MFPMLIDGCRVVSHKHYMPNQDKNAVLLNNTYRFFFKLEELGWDGEIGQPDC